MEVVHVSVVIPTKGRPDLIGGSVRAVLANSYSSFDVTVVDQSADARTAEIVQGLAQADGRLRYVHTLPPGLSRAYNIGIASAKGEIIAFTDDDCVAPPDWIERIVAAFNNDATAQMLYGQVLRPSSLADLSIRVPTLAIERAQRLSARDGFRIVGMGANFAARRTLFQKVGGFDEVLGGGGPLRSSQDFDLQFRVFRAGAVTLLCPEVIVDHYGARTPEQWPATQRAYGYGDGAFYLKHVRCGDAFALSLFARHLARTIGREILIAVGIHRRRSHRIYLRALFEGMRGSLTFPVDRRHRRYEPKAIAGSVS